MADPTLQPDDGCTPTNEHAVLKPSESSPANETEQRTSEHQTEAQEAEGQRMVDEPKAQSSAAAPETEATTKGKEKDERPSQVENKREGDSLSIGPSDLPPPAITGSNTELPVCTITLLLPTGARHPYRIDEKYLAKRNVEVPDMMESGGRDPFSISVYKLKELILREWREEWESKPASPSSIRLIHFGKLLDDKEQLKKYQFSQDSPNVVHMSVRPPEMMEEEEPGKSKSGGRDGRRHDSGSSCCVIL